MHSLILRAFQSHSIDQTYEYTQQIVLGVEGSVHHGFTPILEALAKKQVDAQTGQPYDVTYSEGHLRTAMFGFHGETREITDPKVVKRTFKKMCPNDGRKHIIIEDASFPSGSEDDPRTYRVHRQKWWKDATMEEIATSDSALNHPTNLYSFYKEYSPQANIKFVVLHRSYIETIASHFDFDGTAMQHSNVIRGFLLLLSRFLDSHTIDTYTGERLWTLVCVDRMMGKVHEGNDESLQATRQRIVDYLADFLGWERSDCVGCFDSWRSSRKNHLKILGEENVNIVLSHMKGMGGVWPPVIQDALSDQKCSL